MDDDKSEALGKCDLGTVPYRYLCTSAESGNRIQIGK
jgi:hypothetical protein